MCLGLCSVLSQPPSVCMCVCVCVCVCTFLPGVPDAKWVCMSSSWMSSGDLLLPSTATAKNLQGGDMFIPAGCT